MKMKSCLVRKQKIKLFCLDSLELCQVKTKKKQIVIKDTVTNECLDVCKTIITAIKKVKKKIVICFRLLHADKEKTKKRTVAYFKSNF